MTSKKTICLTDIEVNAMIFQSPGNPKHFYVVGRDDMDFLDFMKKYCVGDQDAKRATGVELDGTGKHFWMVHVEDCFDPPIAIVRADSLCDAEDAFTDALNWAHITDPNDLKDYDEDNLHYSPSGVPYDIESVMIREIKLHGIEIDKLVHCRY